MKRSILADPKIGRCSLWHHLCFDQRLNAESEEVLETFVVAGAEEWSEMMRNHLLC